MKEKTQETAIVPSPESTAAIPEPTARLIEKPFAENTMRNRKQALRGFSYWLNGREITDGLLAEYITHLFDQGKASWDNLYRGLRSEMATETPKWRYAG